MKRFYRNCVLCSLMCVPIIYQPLASATQELHSDDEIEALFTDEEDGFAEAAAQTTVMQQEIEIKPPSRVVLAARRVWDKMLVFYIWMQEKYARMRVYWRARFQRPNAYASQMSISPDSENVM